MARAPVTIADLYDAIPADLRVQLARAGPEGASTPVVDATHDSRRVTPGSLFVCVTGAESDGHRFAPEALAAGSVGLLVERELELDVPQMVVTDSRRAHGHVAAAVHRHPAASLTTVGVTGTNGKTTTTHLLAAALRGAGRDVAVVGTLSGTRTTPEASDLQRTLAVMRDRGTDTVVMEVSSHALALHRIDGMRVDAAVFTNLGRDHLDHHDSMEDYFRAKARLFTPALAAIGIVNADDAHGRLLLDVGEVPIHPFHLADATDVRVGPGEHRFRWRDREVVVPLGGDVNVMNSLAALTTCHALDVDLDRAVGGLASAEAVPGRFELVGVGLEHGFPVVVDYAHTPD
ncbi:MAG: UDP-N-acetylmuramyl-tripeptide synthetase, partial [Ilumatobacteraceae bacterium]